MCEMNGSSKFKKFLRVLLPSIFLAQLAFLVYVFLTVFKVQDAEWNVFLNAKAPVIWTQVSVPLLILFALDWMTKGYVINTILCIDDKSSDARIIAAVVFLVGVFWGLVWACKGGGF